LFLFHLSDVEASSPALAGMPLGCRRQGATTTFANKCAFNDPRCFDEGWVLSLLISKLTDWSTQFKSI
jgi:hypothetical protein